MRPRIYPGAGIAQVPNNSYIVPGDGALHGWVDTFTATLAVTLDDMTAAFAGTVEQVVYVAESAAAATTEASVQFGVYADEGDGATTLASVSSISALVTHALLCSDAYAVALFASLSESAAAATTEALGLLLSISVDEASTVAKSVVGLTSATGSLTDGATVADTFSAILAAAIAESAAGADTLAPVLALATSISEALTGASTETSALVLVSSVDESGAGADSAASVLDLVAAIAEGGVATLLINVDGDVQTWAVNAITGAARQYTNFAFNSFSAFNGVTLACSEDGLYQLGGDDDDGAAIASEILTGITDFGSALMKRVESASVGYASDGTLVLKARTNDGGGFKERLYYLKPQTAGSPREGVVKFAKGVTSRYWQFAVSNINGADFETTAIAWYPMILTRRR